MVKVKFFGGARAKFNEKEISLEAANVKDMNKKIAERFGVELNVLKQFLIYVNEVDIRGLKNYRTKLKDGDTVMYFSPSSGG